MRDSKQSELIEQLEPRPQDASRFGFYPLAQLVLLVLGGWAYWPTLLDITEAWTSNPDYSHGFLVLPIAFALLWAKRDRCPDADSFIRWEGLVLFGLAGLLRYFAGRFYLPNLDGWSIPVWLGGVVLLLQGRSRFSWALPGLVFLWFATPLPGTVEILLSTPLQQVAAQLGGWSLRLAGQPAITEGTTILLNEHVLDIERACSGLRMFYGILAMAVACIVLARVRGWVAFAILLATVPVALFANVCRIVVTAILLQRFSSEAASKFSHDFAGFLMIPLAVTLFAIFLMWLRSTLERLDTDQASGVNWLLRWALSAAVVIGALFAWGNYQQRHVLGVLLEMADRSEQNHDLPSTVSYLERYLHFNPVDQQVAERHAETFAEIAASRRERLRAIGLQYRAWQQNPSRSDLAEEAAREALDLGESRKALQICEEMLDGDLGVQRRNEIKLLYADALLYQTSEESNSAEYSWEAVAEALEATRDVATPSIHYEAELARIWLDKLLRPNQQARAKIALSIMDGLVAKHPQDPLAWLARHHFLIDYELIEGELIDDERASGDGLSDLAARDIRQAVELADRASNVDQTAIYSAAALQAEREGKIDDAQRYLELAISASPKLSRPYVLLAELKRRGDSPESRQEAIEILQQGVEAIGDADVWLLLPLASLQTDIGDWEGAATTLESVDIRLGEFSGLGLSKLKLAAGIVHAEIQREQAGSYPAIRSLESTIGEDSVRMHRQISPRLYAQANVLLGRLYSEVGILDRSSEQYRSALQLDPNSTATRIEAIAPVLNSGDLESAELLCRQLLRDDPHCQDALLATIRLHVRRQLRLSVESRDWSRAERAYEQAGERGVSSAGLFLAKVELLESQGLRQEAELLLEEALELSPNEPILWREAALLADRSGKLERALEAAQKYIESLPEEIEPYVMKATFLEKANRSQEAQELLTSKLEHSSGLRWVMVANELARLKLLLGDLSDAKSLLEEIREREPTNLNAIDTLASLAWATGDQKSLSEYESWLHDVEGEMGALWRFHRAQRLLAEASSTEDPKFEEVSRLSQALQSLRPRWSKTSMLLGDIALRAGKSDVAISAFQRAWNLGDRSALLADQLLELLTRQGRDEEARSYILQVRNSLSLSSRLFDRAIPLFVRGGEATSALRLAEAWVARQPMDANAHLRLGGVLMALSDQSDEAEYLERARAALRRALELNPQDVELWVANVSCAMRSQGDQLVVSDFLQQLGQQAKLNGYAGEFMFAQVNEELGYLLAAREHFKRAIRLVKLGAERSEIAKVLASAASFYREKVPHLAERHAREALANSESETLARQVLVQILAESNVARQTEEALTLMDAAQEELDADNADLNRRMRARLLAKRGVPSNNREAIRLLETLLQKTPDDKLLLAALFERQGRLGPAFEILSQVASARAARPSDQVAFLEFWQTHFLSKATPPNRPQFVSIAEVVYSRLLELPSQQAEWLRWKLRERRLTTGSGEVADVEVQELIVELEAANRNINDWREELRSAWCRMVLHVMLDEQMSDFVLQYVQQPRVGLSEVDLAITLCHALILSPRTYESHAALSDYLQALQFKYAERADLTRAVGDYEFMAGRFDLAAESYQHLLSRNPSDRLASNNLALSLAELPEGLAEADTVLSKTIEEFGEDSILLDTRAVIALIAGRAEEALRSLEKAIQESPEDSTILIHKAMAYQQLGKFSLMQSAIEDAMLLGVNESLLSVRDREFYREISQSSRTMKSRITPGEVDAVAIDDSSSVAVANEKTRIRNDD